MKVANTRGIKNKIESSNDVELLNSMIQYMLAGPIALDQITFTDAYELESRVEKASQYMKSIGVDEFTKDEIISIHFSEIDPSIKKIICCVTIDQAIQRQQTFGMVSNSYVRLVNSETNEEIAKFTLKNDYDTSTAVIFAELVHTDGNWVFHTIGEGLVADLNQIVVRFQ